VVEAVEQEDTAVLYPVKTQEEVHLLKPLTQ